MKINILIVDDCPVMRLVIRRTVQMCGLEIGEIVEAGNGREGLEKIKHHKFNLIIVDIYMPVMGGSEMLKILRNEPKTKNIPVLTVSTESNKTRVELFEGMSTAFVHKPFAPEELRQKVQNAINGDDLKGSKKPTMKIINLNSN